MSQILLIGRGPLPSPDSAVTSFSQLRTAHFKQALEEAGHHVRVALLCQSAGDSHLTSWPGVATVAEEGPGWLEVLAELSEGADFLVAAGPYNPSRAACLIAQDRPVWADLPGDPFAELHALAAACNGPLSAEQLAAAEAAALPVLARADAISVISTPQRHALMGELGAMGRLQPGAMPVIATIPIAMPTGDPQEPRPRQPQEPLVIALSGAFNPWFDDRTAAAGLERVLRARPQTRVIVTGGGLPGFYEDGARRFSQWATSWPDQVSMKGWLPLGEVAPALAQAHVGLSLDLPGPEPELGSRTRLLSFIQHGLWPVATTGSQLAQEMANLGELTEVPPTDPSALAEALIEIADEAAPQAALRQAQSRLSSTYAAQSITTPLVEWAAQPSRVKPADLPAATLASQLAQERDALAQVHASPTWRTLSWLHRLVRRD